MVTQSAKARHAKPQPAQLRFEKIAVAILKKLYPCVASAITAGPSGDETRVIPHGNELTPSPKSKVFAISALGLFELFRRQPILLLAKLLLV